MIFGGRAGFRLPPSETSWRRAGTAGLARLSSRFPLPPSPWPPIAPRKPPTTAAAAVPTLGLALDLARGLSSSRLLAHDRTSGAPSRGKSCCRRNASRWPKRRRLRERGRVLLQPTADQVHTPKRPRSADRSKPPGRKCLSKCAFHAKRGLSGRWAAAWVSRQTVYSDRSCSGASSSRRAKAVDLRPHCRRKFSCV